tara:strand:- start:36 stop:635 length:600 start_codon:yes stop_codon:yes gene_type:complete
MPVTINGNGSITGLSVGGLPDGCVDTDTLANNSVTSAKSVLTEGIKMVDQWRLTANTSITASTGYFIDSNWERVDSDNFGQLGTGMTESSGVFTFPTTGIYLVQTTTNFRNPNSNSGGYAYITVSTNGGSSFDDAALSLGWVSASNRYSTATCSHVLDVTDTSQIKVMLKVYVTASSTVAEGNTNRTMTGMTFMRLGDT